MGKRAKCCCCCCIREIDLIFENLLAIRVPVVNTGRLVSTISGQEVVSCFYRPAEYLTANGLAYIADIVVIDRDFNRDVHSGSGVISSWRRGVQKWLQAFVVRDFLFALAQRQDGQQRLQLQPSILNNLLVGASTGFRLTDYSSTCSIASDTTLSAGLDDWSTSFIRLPFGLFPESPCLPSINAFFRDAFTPILQRVLDVGGILESDWAPGTCETPRREVTYDFPLREWNHTSNVPDCRIPLTLVDINTPSSFTCTGLGTAVVTTQSDPPATFSSHLRIKVHYCGDPSTPLEEVDGPENPVTPDPLSV